MHGDEDSGGKKQLSDFIHWAIELLVLRGLPIYSEGSLILEDFAERNHEH